MRRTLVTLALGLVLAAAQGCASMGVGNPFSNDLSPAARTLRPVSC